MSFTLFLDSQTPALAARHPLVKSAERVDFENATTLLTEVRAMHARTSDDIDAIRTSARAEGYQEGLARAEGQIEAMLVEITKSFDKFSADRRDDIARAAYAAVRAILGGLDDETIVAKLVDASLARLDTEAPVTVEVSPAMADRITAQLSERAHVTVRGNEALGAKDCHIISPQGRIVAGLTVQMDALAERWGVEQGADA
jgi:flagellar biosynthesis/type III secretory pathway protein FliH